MTIEFEKEDSAPAQQPAPVQAAPSFSHTAPPQPQPMPQNMAPPPSWRFGDPSLTGPISFSQGSDDLIKLRDKIKEIFKEVNTPDQTFHALSLDNRQVSGIYYSSIIICLDAPQAKSPVVPFYTMLLAGTREEPSSKTEQIMGQNVEVKVVPGEVFDNVYVQHVQRVVSEAFPKRRMVNCGGTMVPKDFNTEDPAAIHRLIANASTAVYANMRIQQPDFADINLTAAGNDNNLQVNVIFGRETVDNNVSEPMRSDVDISFVTAQQNQNQNQNASLNDQVRRAEKFGKVMGFIEPVWAPVQVAQNGWGMYNPQLAMAMTQKYAARFVITHMESTHVPTLPSYLLLLLTALPVGVNNTWFHAFYNQSRFIDKKGAIDLTDIGALNIEANLPTAQHPQGNPSQIGDRVDTRSKEFTSDKFGMYMMRMFREGLVYSLDVPLTGPQSWYLDVFKAANENNRNALGTIIAAADYLTGGAFTHHYGSDHSVVRMFAEPDNIIHLGYYEDVDGRRRDISDIDHLAVLNMYGENDMSVVRKWSDSFLQTSRPIQLRMAERWNIIQAITKNKAVLTGIAERVTFTDHFLQALNAATASVGLSIRTNVPATGLGMQVERGVATFVNQALVPANYGTVFHQSSGPVMQGSGIYGTRQFNRWQ